jgi:hypothetical protein
MDLTDGVVPKAKVLFSGQIQKFTQNTAKRIILPLSWRRFSKDLLVHGALSMSEKTVILLPEGLVLEGNLPNNAVDEGSFKLRIKSSMDSNNLTIEKQLAFDKKPETPEEEIEKSFQRIYSQVNKSISFQKPVSNE